jgi:hypothetical protein
MKYKGAVIEPIVQHTLPNGEIASFALVFFQDRCFIQLADGRMVAEREGGQWKQLHPNWVVNYDGESISFTFVPDK